MQKDFVISVRNRLAGGKLGNEPGRHAHFLTVPRGEEPNAVTHRVSRKEWLAMVREKATRRTDEAGHVHGDVLIFGHGYNATHSSTMTRHALLEKRLGEKGFKGAIVTFDWPSEGKALAYLEDRFDVKQVAHLLVTQGIMLLQKQQQQADRLKCALDVHFIGHSTGAYVLREACYQASQNADTRAANWRIGQVVFVGADVAASSMDMDDKKAKHLYARCGRLTNYVNGHDSVLRVSNAKRLMLAPRVGRIGLPLDAPRQAYDVHCTNYWKATNPNASNAPGSYAHSWHFDDPKFAEDLLHTMIGEIDRRDIPTRRVEDGKLHLI